MIVSYHIFLSPMENKTRSRCLYLNKKTKKLTAKISLLIIIIIITPLNQNKNKKKQNCNTIETILLEITEIAIIMVVVPTLWMEEKVKKKITFAWLRINLTCFHWIIVIFRSIEIRANVVDTCNRVPFYSGDFFLFTSFSTVFHV